MNHMPSSPQGLEKMETIPVDGTNRGWHEARNHFTNV